MAGNLAHMTGVGHGQAAGGVVVTEQSIGNGVAALFGREAALQDGGNMLLLPQAEWNRFHRYRPQRARED